MVVIIEAAAEIVTPALNVPVKPTLLWGHSQPSGEPSGAAIHDCGQRQAAGADSQGHSFRNGGAARYNQLSRAKNNKLCQCSHGRNSALRHRSAARVEQLERDLLRRGAGHWSGSLAS